MSDAVNVPSFISIYQTAAIWWGYREYKNVICCYWKPPTFGILLPREVRNHGNRGVTQSHMVLWKVDILH